MQAPAPALHKASHLLTKSFNLASYGGSEADRTSRPTHLVELLRDYDLYDSDETHSEFGTDNHFSLGPHNSFEERTRKLVAIALKYLDRIREEVYHLALCDDIWDILAEDNGIAKEESFDEDITNFAEDLKEAIIKTTECLVGLQRRQLREELLEDVCNYEESIRCDIQAEFESSRSVFEDSEDEETTLSQSATREEKEQVEEDEEAEKAEAAQQEYEKSRRRLLSKRAKKLWVHLTISRDQTAASDFRKEQLLALRSPNANRPIETGEQNALNTSEGTSTQDSHSPLQALGTRVVGESSVAAFKTQNLQLQPKKLGPIREVPTRYLPNMTLPTLDFGTPLVSASGVQESDINTHDTELSSNIENRFNDIDALRDRVRLLEEELNTSQKSIGTKATWQALYFLEDRPGGGWAAYLDEPTWYINQNGEAKLKASSLIHNVEAYLNNKLDTAFVTSKHYNPSKQGMEAQQASREGHTLPQPEPFQETIRLWSQGMTTAFKEFVEKQPDLEKEIGKFNAREFIRAPYLFWYQYRSPTALDGLTPKSFDMMKLLTSWIDDNYGDLYNRGEEQRARGVVSPETMQFLIRPGDVVVWKEKKDLMAVIAKSWPRLSSEPDPTNGSELLKWSKHPAASDSTPSWMWNFETREIRYDGSFYYQKTFTQSTLKAKSFRTEVPIPELSAYPLRYASDEWKRDLERRGEIFWSCRKRRLVAYDDDRGFYGSSERFMVDFATYEELHSDTVSFKRSYPMIDDPDCDRMDAQTMESDDPPSAPEIYIFPNNIVGYNLRSKKWIDLEVDKIREVSWNKKSFDHLVVDYDTKELVHALVTNQISRENGTDIIDRKGNGLIILLHGSPGTGKTFTAESVAEIAEKPLFRVTCGDIGTKPEDVEKYLESVLHLGKSWGCVVLLDEAEVFLEQRRLTDLERNALVSVFLRVLEYYEGILILTSNRVGTFDEAFKSRIQLSLHYENLTESQRRRIWRNFLNRLKTLDEAVVEGPSRDPPATSDSIGIDFEDIDCYLPELAKHELNGRQIRNAITTARQLAQFKGEKMMSRHLRHVIKVSDKFDSYLKKVQDGLSDDDAARGYGLR